MNDKIQYFTKNKNGWEPVKFEDGSSIPPKGLLQYKPSPFEIETQIEARRNKKAFKDLRAIILGDMKSKTKWSVFIKNAKAVQS